MSTVQDVARMAGVSTASVSRVLNGYAHVSPQVSQRVNQAINVLGFQPNLTAKSLRTSKTYRIVVTVPDITNSFFSNIIRGAEETAQAAGYSVLLGDVGADVKAQENYAAMVQRREADGLIFLGHSLPASLERRSTASERVPQSSTAVNFKMG